MAINTYPSITALNINGLNADTGHQNGREKDNLAQHAKE